MVAIIIITIASQFGQGVMSEVVQNRIDCPDWVYTCLPRNTRGPYVAYKDCSKVGDPLWLKRGENWIRTTIADCPHPQDGTEKWMRENRIDIELSWELADKLNTIGRGLQVMYSLSDPTKGMRLEP